MSGRPRFVDIEDGHAGIDPDLVAGRGRAADRRHPPGPRLRPAVPDRSRSTHIAEPRRVAAIEDACEALGSASERSTGSARTARRPSSRSIPTSRSRPAKAGWSSPTTRRSPRSFRSLRNQGRDEDGTWLRHVRLGYNYRLDELSAAIGVGSARASARTRGRSRSGGGRLPGGARRPGLGSPAHERTAARPWTGSSMWCGWTHASTATRVIADLEAPASPAGPTSARSTSSRSIREAFGYGPATSR